MKILSLKDLSNIGFERKTYSFSIVDADRDESEFLYELKLESLAELTMDHPEVLSAKESLLRFCEKHDINIDDSHLKCFISRNDIGGSSLRLAFFDFQEQETIFKCFVIDEYGDDDILYLKQVSAIEEKDYRYLTADDQEFKGQIIKAERTFFS